MSASSAATEIMKTPRSESIRASILVVRLVPLRSSCAAISPPSDPPGRGGRVAQKALARVGSVQRVGESVDGAALVLVEVLRHVDRHAVADVAAVSPSRPRRSLAAQALD